jgi:hypothetical protein
MDYNPEKYQEHLTAVQSMRREVGEHLSGIGGYTLIVSDSSGLIVASNPEGAPEGLNDDQNLTIRVDLSKNSVTVQNYYTLRREHSILEDLGVLHEYAPRSYSPLEEGRKPAVIQMTIGDAIGHLRDAMAAAKTMPMKYR